MTSNSIKKIAIIIPALNEERTIGQVIAGLKKITPQVIVVNDGSLDKTAKIAQNAGAFVINHQINQGYGRSLSHGFQEAQKQGADIIVSCDGDGQHRLEDIQKVIAPLLHGQFAAVAGQRNYLQHWAEKIFAFYTKKRFNVIDPLSGLKAYDMELFQTIGHFETFNSIGSQLFLEAIKKGYKTTTVSVFIEPRLDQSRFYRKKIKANLKILKAMLQIIWYLR